MINNIPCYKILATIHNVHLLYDDIEHNKSSIFLVIPTSVAFDCNHFIVFIDS